MSRDCQARSERQRTVLRYIERSRVPVLGAQIARETGLTQQQVAGACRTLHRCGMIERYFRDEGSACRWGAVR